MRIKTKVFLGVLAGVFAIFAISFLPRLARTIDASLEPAMAQAAANEAHYRNMTNAYPIAAEMMPGHPTRQLWEDSKAALVQAGYIETRELPLRRGLARKNGVVTFFSAFHARFPGVECSLRGAKSEQPIVSITARKNDFGAFGAIERWVHQYDPNSN